MDNLFKKNKGYTLIEVIIAISIFVGVSAAVYGGYSRILRVISVIKEREIATALVNERFEIIRNMPYASVGTYGGIPSGQISSSESLVRDGISFVVNTTIRNYDDPYDGTLGGDPNDLSPADAKLVEVEVSCSSCQNFVPVFFSTRISPKNLETSSTNGALVIKVFDADGVALADANVSIVNDSVSPTVNINDVTGIDGTLTIVDAPPATETYEITVTKSGYSTDRTYPVGDINNPNPSKPHATVLTQQITQLSFSIDEVSSISVSTKLQTCSAVAGIDFNLFGSKLIGTVPDILKYDVDHTSNGSGQITINNLDWDTYNMALTDSSYDLIGTNPLLALGLTPGASQPMDVIVASKDPNRLLVVVTDQSTALPLEGVDVQLVKTGFDETKTTGRGYINQTDWSGGAGQEDFIIEDEYSSSDGNTETDNPAGSLKLRDVLGFYVSDGNLISSTFDVGEGTNFSNIYWEPLSQPLNTDVKFQVASSNSTSSAWVFTGPDGATSSYYFAGNQDIHSSNNGNRYFRYKVLLESDDSSETANITDASFTFTSSCVPPGQVSFGGLSSGEYTITISKSGYDSYVQTNYNIDASWQKLEIALSPS